MPERNNITLDDLKYTHSLYSTTGKDNGSSTIDHNLLKLFHESKEVYHIEIKDSYPTCPGVKVGTFQLICDRWLKIKLAYDI